MTTIRRGYTVAALLLCPAALAAPRDADAQGCVCVRAAPLPALPPGGAAPRWTASVGLRWFRSSRDFVGDVERADRYGRIVNEVTTLDLSAAYHLSDRWSVTLSLPLSRNERASDYEHDQLAPRAMTAGGAGDLRLALDAWLLDPRARPRGNVSVGLAVVAPTGDYDAADNAWRAGGPVRRPVDPSIQPGSGGWGVALQVQAYLRLSGGLSGYFNAAYTATPQEQNGTEYTLADVARAAAYLSPSQRYDSVPDQYLARAGLSLVVWPDAGLSAALGGRLEGVAVSDLVGGSLGFRRPGYVVSLEPGVAWRRRRESLTLSVPVALYRNRQRSEAEAARGQAPGDSSFADLSVLAGYAHQF